MTTPNRPRRSYPSGVPCWIDLEVADADAAIAFYSSLFAWTFDDRLPSAGPDRYAVATLDGLTVGAIASAPPARAEAPAWNTYVAVDDADAVAAAVVRAGGTIASAPADVGPAGRMATVRDPAGAPVRLWQAGTNRGAEAVNGDGTWNWSNLHSPEPDAVVDFYAAVFGWELETIELGGGEALMWRRPGYGDVLAQSEPDLRERQDRSGAPPGFADAIAWIEPVPGGQPSRWAVSFAVGDTDEVAERAVALGGAVLVAPYDAGPARVGVLADALGAELTVSHFDPTRL